MNFTCWVKLIWLLHLMRFCLSGSKSGFNYFKLGKLKCETLKSDWIKSKLRQKCAVVFMYIVQLHPTNTFCIFSNKEIPGWPHEGLKWEISLENDLRKRESRRKFPRAWAVKLLACCARGNRLPPHIYYIKINTLYLIPKYIVTIILAPIINQQNDNAIWPQKIFHIAWSRSVEGNSLPHDSDNDNDRIRLAPTQPHYALAPKIFAP